MHRVGGNIPSTVPGTVTRAGENVQIGMGGQETPSESSEADSSECDTSGDEDGWESGESSTSLMVNHHPLTHSSSQTQINTHHRASLRETAKGLLSRCDKGRSSNRQSTASVRRSLAFVRSATFDA